VKAAVQIGFSPGTVLPSSFGAGFGAGRQAMPALFLYKQLVPPCSTALFCCAISPLALKEPITVVSLRLPAQLKGDTI